MTAPPSPDADAGPDPPPWPGRPLSELLGEPMAPDRYLAIAIPLARAVARMHRQGTIHRDLKPANVLVSPDTSEVRLAGFGLAGAGPLEPAAVRATGRIAGTPAYMAPEQSGRLNRPVDHRADLYALGVISYEMLTATLPCAGEDLAAVIHCHLALRPEPPAARTPGVPATLSDLVLKLLAKAPEDRYQAAAGLATDLQRCRDALDQAGVITPFPLGEGDVPEQFALPRRLYGRTRELALMRETFEAVMGDGRPRGVLLGGVAGVGKSSLVEELRLPVAQRHGRLAAGKFTGPRRDVPMTAITQILRELTSDILAEPESQVGPWRARVLAAPAGTARLVTDLVPELAALLGPQPAVPELPPAEARNRLALAIRRFLGTIARADHPLVLFFDDLQWADPADFALIAQIATATELTHVLFVGAYRQEEIGPDHPMWHELERVEAGGLGVERLVLKSLAVADLTHLLGDAFRAEGPTVAALARLVHLKTAGNPFFVRRLVTRLHEEGLIRFLPDEGAWAWDLARIRRRAIADNVAEMLVGQLRRLAPATRETLGLAACLGPDTTLTQLVACAPGDAAGSARALEPATRRGFVFLAGDTVEFTHDRIREAARALITDDRCARAHLRVGRLLLATAGATPERGLYEVARHLNQGAALIDDPTERAAVAAVDLRAGRHAKGAAAFEAARDFVSAGLALLGDAARTSQRELAAALRLELAHIDAMLGRFDAAEATLDEVRKQASSPFDRSAADRIAVELRIRRGDLPGALEVARAGLADLGQALPADVTRAQVADEITAALRALGARDDAALLALALLADPAIEAAMALMSASLPAAYFTAACLHDLLGCRLARLTLTHGLGGPSGLGFVLLGMVLCEHQARYEDGHRFARLAIALAELRGPDAFQGQVFALAASFVTFWVRPYAENLTLLRRAREAAREAGDLTYVCYVGSQEASALLASGAPLTRLTETLDRLAEDGRQAEFPAMGPVTDTLHHFVRTLAGEPSVFAGPPPQTLPFTLALDHVARLQAAYLLGDDAGAWREAEAAEPLMWAVASQKPVVVYQTFRALTLARRIGGDGDPARQAGLAVLRRHVETIGAWAAACPENFGATRVLVGAEVARLEGRDLEALQGYEQAAREAEAQGDVRLTGLARELAARRFGALGLTQAAEAALAAARRAYQAWGAHALVARLGGEQAPGAPAAPPTLSLPAEHLDVLAVVKASQALAGEILLDRLAGSLMTLMLQQAGADRGWLFRATGQALEPVAEAIADAAAGAAIAVRLQPGDVSVPRAVIDYVSRTHRPLTLDDPADADRFCADPYFQTRRPRSVLCLPLLRQGLLSGLLYLENNLTAGAFPEERLGVLELLAAQAAISLENARLYEAEADRARFAAREAAARAELAAARELDEAKDAFISAINHDLRAPVSAIMGYAEFLTDGLGGPINEVQAGYALQILHAAERLSSMLEDMLETARLEAGAFALRREPADLAVIVREVVGSLVPQLQAAGVAVDQVLDAPLVGHWDPARIGQVLTNLLGNAIKFTPRGGHIRITASERGDRLRVSVADPGPGIALADQPRLWLRFSQLPAGAKKGGAGLGLSIVKALVEAHGGHVGVESEPGHGATFWFELPRELPASPS